jgi:hypothetical protein
MAAFFGNVTAATRPEIAGVSLVDIFKGIRYYAGSRAFGPRGGWKTRPQSNGQRVQIDCF